MEWYKRHDLLERLNESSRRVADNKKVDPTDVVTIIDALYALVEELIDPEIDRSGWD